MYFIATTELLSRFSNGTENNYPEIEKGEYKYDLAIQRGLPI